MGGFCTLHLGLRYPELVSSLVIAGCGYGAQPEARESFRHESAVIAAAFEQEGTAAVAERYAVGPARVQFQNKNPEGWAVFASALAEHSATGMARTMLGVQRERPSLYDLQNELRALDMPVLIIAGDEDDGCLEPDLMLKRTIPAAGPRGHAQHRAHLQPRGARDLQPHRVRVPHGGRGRSLAHARSAQSRSRRNRNG